MKGKGKVELDNFLLNCGSISQDEREEIINFVNTLSKELELK